jgi:hypothetical protein
VKVSRRETLDRYYVVKLFGCAIFVHRIHHDDPIDVFHTHPWSWLSVILGSYDEERFGRAPQRRRLLNFIRAGDAHRVTLPNGPVWTILIHGPRRCPWVVVDRDGEIIEVEPWRGVENPTRKSYV